MESMKLKDDNEGRRAIKKKKNDQDAREWKNCLTIVWCRKIFDERKGGKVKDLD